MRPAWKIYYNALAVPFSHGRYLLRMKACTSNHDANISNIADIITLYP
jgi:hypothetical protein